MRELTTWQEWFDADELIATAFLYPWDPDEARQARQDEAEGKKPHLDQIWATYAPDGRMESAIQTLPMKLAFDGAFVPATELEMVGSRPEYRGSGNVRAMITELFGIFRKRGDLFALLIPFSAAFYRKYGFEQVTRNVQHRIPIDQLQGFSCQLPVRQASRPEESVVLCRLYNDFALGHNLGIRRDEAEFAWRPGPEFGERDFLHQQSRRYTYIFGPEGAERGYLTFRYECKPDLPFVGSMCIDELVFDGPETLRAMLGFVYGLRAKCRTVEVTTWGGLDLGLLLPEPSEATRELEGHHMARILNVVEVLRRMRYPQAAGEFSLAVHDDVMPQNAGCYRVSFADGRAVEVKRTEDETAGAAGEADLELDQRALTQLVLGTCGLDEALWRPGVSLRGNRGTLAHVFRRKGIAAL